MGVILAILQFLLIAFICIEEVKRKSPVAFMWATLLIMFGIMHLLSVISGRGMYPGSVMTKASLFVIVFCLLYIFTRILTVNLWRRTSSSFAYENMIVHYKNEKGNFIFIIFSISAVVMMWKLISFSGGWFNTSWSSGRDYSASLGYVNSNQILYVFYFALGGVALYLWMIGMKKKGALSVILMMLVVVITRNRITVIPVLVCLITYVIFRTKKLKIKHFILAGIAAIFVIYLVYGLRVFRHYGSIGIFVQEFDLFEFVEKVNQYIATDNGELGLRNDFYYFIAHNNNFSGFGTGASYRRMFMVYIPTQFSFGLKPDDFAITMGAATGMAAGGSTHPTLFGDCYANLGWIGVVLGMFWALYASFVDKITMKFKNNMYKTLAYCLFASMYVIMGRGSVYNSFFYVAYGIPLLCVLSYFHTHIKKVRFVGIRHNKFYVGRKND